MTRSKAAFLVLALILGGCVSSAQRGRGIRNTASTSWPWPSSHHNQGGQAEHRTHTARDSGGANTASSSAGNKSSSPTTNPAKKLSSQLRIIPRSAWTNTKPIRRKVNLMNGINKITVHHEGWKTVYFTDPQRTAKRIQKIRKIHTRDRGWGDIGYHFVIDRAGRLWQARPLKYQGAHTRNHNPHNLGIVLLGNFNKQNPSPAQLHELVKALKYFQNAFDVPTKNVHSHGELVSTDCPGKNLQRHMDDIRAQLH